MLTHREGLSALTLASRAILKMGCARSLAVWEINTFVCVTHLKADTYNVQE
jgi:hypothetical protein